MDKPRLRLGLITDYIHSDYSEYLLSGVQKACKDFDADLFIFTIGELRSIHYSYDYQYVAVAAFISTKNLDGVIFSTGTQLHFMSKSDLLSYIKGFNPLPVVCLSASFPGFPSITVDCTNAYRELINHLIDEQHCKKFGIMGIRGGSLEAKNRTKCIKKILEERNVPSSDITLWKSNFDYNNVYDDLNEYYQKYKKFDFDVVICLSDEMAYGAMDFCKKINKRVPEDILIAGFDDLERSQFCFTPLTSINQQIFEQGYKSAEILLDVINGKKVPDNSTIEAKTVFRESTCKYGTLNKSAGDISQELSLKYSGLEWYSKKGQIYQITKFYTDMQSDMTLEQLRSRINDDTRSFGITSCAIVLYENPIEMGAPFDYFNLPHKAKIFSGFDYFTGFDSNNLTEEIKFNPNECILPSGILHESHEGLMIISLFHNTLQYGYIVLHRGSYDVTVYDLFTKITSSIIANIYSFALMHTESTKYRAKYDKLDVIARTDELTGLNNRRGLFELGQTTLKFAKAMDQSGMIIYCDMDGLKTINDTYGHEVGDRAIVAESIILRGNFRSNDVVARIGGDEFVVICPGLNEAAFERIKAQVNVDCQKWSEDNKTPYQLSISMGSVVYPSNNHGYQLTPLLAQADQLLYKEKRNKKKK